jgi:hypothetical protein
MSSTNKITEINEYLRKLKEEHHVDFLNPKGIGLGGKSYFAIDKTVNMPNKIRTYRSGVRIPYENGNISEMLIGKHPTENAGIEMYATYRSNVGAHLQHLPDREEDNLHEEYFINGSDELLHTTLANHAKEPSMAIKMPNVDNWEDYSGKLVSGDEARKVFAQHADDSRHGTSRHKFRNPNKILVSYNDGNYTYDHTTEQLRKLDTWERDV